MRFSSSLLLTLVACALQSRSAQAKLGARLTTTQSDDHEQQQQPHRRNNTSDAYFAFPKLHLRDREEESRHLQDLVYYGGKPDPERIPLGLCEGDCDEDADVSYLQYCINY